MSKSSTPRTLAESDQTDWERLRAMSDEEAEANALADPDTQPLSEESRARRGPRAGIIRRALGLTQEDFADRYGIPLVTLRGWEDGGVEPDQPALAYLRVIAKAPDATARAYRGEAA